MLYLVEKKFPLFQWGNSYWAKGNSPQLQWPGHVCSTIYYPPDSGLDVGKSEKPLMLICWSDFSIQLPFSNLSSGQDGYAAAKSSGTLTTALRQARNLLAKREFPGRFNRYGIYVALYRCITSIANSCDAMTNALVYAYHHTVSGRRTQHRRQGDSFARLIIAEEVPPRQNLKHMYYLS